MSLSRYGFQKLVLLNSAGYSLAELPLDASVSLIAPNNTGKTSLINALQFLLILDKRNMDFGSHTPENSRKFYFPSPASYILLEVLLEKGTVIIGCVGKGFSHDYDYFAYQGNLDLDDYRLDNTIITQAKLRAHLTARGKLAKFYDQAELKSMFYGGTKQRLKHHDIDLTIFPLEMPSLATTYQKVLTRTLRLDKLTSKEVKDYLMEIFKRELTDSSIDFKGEWDKHFDEVNKEKQRIDAVEKAKSLIEKLESMQTKRKILRGELIIQRPELEQALKRWQTFYFDKTKKLKDHEQQVKQQEHILDNRIKTIIHQQVRLSQEIKGLNNLEQQYQALRTEFVFITDDQQLTKRRNSLQEQLFELGAELKQVQYHSTASIKRELSEKEKLLNQLNQQLNSLHDNFYLRLKSYLPDETFVIISRLFSKETLTLAVGERHAVQFNNEAEFKQFANNINSVIDNEFIKIAGLNLNTQSLTCQLTLKNKQELEQEIIETQQAMTILNNLLVTALNIENKQKQKENIEKEIKKLDQDIQRYDVFLELKAKNEQRQQTLTDLSKQLEEIKQEELAFDETRQKLNEEKDKIKSEQSRLIQDNENIDKLRRERRDQNHAIDHLKQLPHIPSVTVFAVNLPELFIQLEKYNRDYSRLLELDKNLNDNLHTLHNQSVTQFQYYDSAEEELEHLFRFTAELAKEKDLVAKHARTAVISVATLLRELKTSLESLKRCMNDFNKLINKRQLSDLKVFKIEIKEDNQLVEAIKTLISSSEKLETGESFDLFNQYSVLDDSAINKAKELLIKEGTAREGLRLKDLFYLKFILAKENQKEKDYDDIDSAASNGTVLMIKLITGLAMLNLMQDERQTKIHTACYLDEAASLDMKNQHSLITTAAEFGFALIFASPEAQTTANYCVPIRTKAGKNQITYKDWQELKPL